MHEAAIASGILDAVRRTLEDREPVRLRVVRVRIGEFAGVVAECLEFAWEVLRAGTLAEGVPLEIESVPATARCRACGVSYPVEDVSLLCPRCGGLDVELVTGREMIVSELEVDARDDSGGTP